MSELDEAIERFNDITTDLFTAGMAVINQVNSDLQEINKLLENER